MNKIKRLAFFNSLEIPAAEEGKEQEIQRPPPGEFLIIKFGKNTFTKDGIKGDFEFTANDADAVISEFENRKRDLVIDYEHQTLSGSQAPAAGWINTLEKTAEGLLAKVKYWTRQADAYLKNGEYRYISPVLQFSRRGRTVQSLHSVALTNHPALHGIPALVADDAADEDSSPDNNIQNTKKGVIMDELSVILGLDDLKDLSPEEQDEKLRNEVRKLAESRDSLDRFLKLHDCGSLDELEKIMSSLVPSSEMEKLESKIKTIEAEGIVCKAFSDGKLTENLRQWAMDFAGKDLNAFRQWAESAPNVVPLNDETDQAGEIPFSDTLSRSGIKILRNLGIPEKQIEEILSSKKQ